METGNFSCGIKGRQYHKKCNLAYSLLVDRVRNVTQRTGSSYKGSVSEDGKFKTSFFLSFFKVTENVVKSMYWEFKMADCLAALESCPST